MKAHLSRWIPVVAVMGVAVVALASVAGLLLTGNLKGVVSAPWASGGPVGRAAAFTLTEVGGAAPAGAAVLVADPNGLGPRGPSASPITAADVPDLVSLQGRLTDSSGNPVADSSYSIRFSIWDAASSGSELWNETQNVSTSKGLFNVLLGSVATLTRTVFDGTPRYLELKVGADPAMTPRQRFVTVPYAFFAEQAADLVCTDCVSAAEVQFNYAGSTSEGGAASNLSCTDCVSSSEVQFNYAGSTSEGGAASNLSCTDCVSVAEVQFNYAGSTSEGGAASDLSCTDCVSVAEVQFNYAGSSSEGGGAVALSRLGFSTTTVDSASNGGYASVTVGVDGLPLVSYASSGDLKVVHCGNAACTSGNTITTVDSTDNVGYYTSVTVGTDGLPIISYYDNTNGDLRVAHCGNALCNSGNTITTVDGNLDPFPDVGNYTSVTVGKDGLPIISYYDETNDDLKVAHCGNAACSAGNTITTVDGNVDPFPNVGKYTSVTVGKDGLPIISYYDETNDDLKVAHCGNVDCTSSNTITTVDSANTVGWETSVTVGADGLPIISYFYWNNSDLKVAHCDNVTCSSSTITTVDGNVDPFPSVGQYTSVTVGTDGLPIISYYDNTNDDLKVARCGNAACSSGNTITVVDSTGDVGKYTSLTVGTDGLPVISYYDDTNDDLKVAHCSNRFCVPYHRPR